jgi:hypothetical protein
MLNVIYAEFHLCSVSFMLSVANILIMLSVVMLNVVAPFKQFTSSLLIVTNKIASPR